MMSSRYSTEMQHDEACLENTTQNISQVQTIHLLGLTLAVKSKLRL